MDDGVSALIGVVVFIMAGVVLLITAMNNRRRLLEVAHRERLMMIERGLVPAPEVNPAAFESATGLGVRRTSSGERYRTAGVIMIGLGLSMMVLLSFAAGTPSIGLGVGGAWAILGGACLLNYLLMSRRDFDSYGSGGRWQSSSGNTPAPPPGDTHR